MKKTHMIVALVLAGAAQVAFAQAAATFFQGVIPNTNQNQVTPADCELLSQNVQITLSTNVNAAWGCSLANNTMTAGACSTAGATRTRTIQCSRRTVTAADGSTSLVKNVATCPDTPPGTGADVATITGRVFYIGNSGGGQVNASPLGDGTTTCTSTNIQGAFEWPQG